MTVIGARPQFIKAAVVSRALGEHPEVEEEIVHTGQHYDVNMSDVFFEELGIPAPKYHLGIGSGLHGAQTGRMMELIEKVAIERRPDWVLLYGDTNSTLAGALAAAKLHIPVAHVEAGVRSFNRNMPEEINRILTDRISDLLFAPTENAVSNLKREGMREVTIHNVGDVMYDAALLYSGQSRPASDVLRDESLAPGKFVLATIHRAENTDDPTRLAAILQGLAEVAQDLPVVLPLHPRTQAAITRHGLGANLKRKGVLACTPVGYIDMLGLLKDAAVIVTDSGGVQKEAFFQGRPCVTLRTETEWVELVQNGWNHVVPPITAGAIRESIQAALSRGPGRPFDGYGAGNAAREIVEILLKAAAERKGTGRAPRDVGSA